MSYCLISLNLSCMCIYVCRSITKTLGYLDIVLSYIYYFTGICGYDKCLSIYASIRPCLYICKSLYIMCSRMNDLFNSNVCILAHTCLHDDDPARYSNEYNIQDGSRTPDSAGIIARNLMFGASPGLTPSTKVVAFYTAGVWNVSTNIRYPPGDAVEPPRFTDVPPEELNLVNDELRIVLFLFTSLVIVGAFVAIAWVIKNRRAAVMSASQPAFLLLIATGCVISTASSFLRGWNEVDVPNMVMLNGICNATWWMASVGMTLVTTGFVLKIYRIVRLFSAKTKLKSVVVKLRSLLSIVVLMLAINFVLIAAWYYVAPLGKMMIMSPSRLRFGYD